VLKDTAMLTKDVSPGDSQITFFLKYVVGENDPLKLALRVGSITEWCSGSLRSKAYCSDANIIIVVTIALLVLIVFTQLKVFQACQGQ
jgi:hypothetical protein